MAVIYPKEIGENDDQLLLAILLQIFNHPLIGIVLLGIMASAISTANSQLLVLTNSILSDIIPNISLKVQMKYYRFILLISVSVSALIALNRQLDILNYGLYIWGGLAITFFWPLYGGFFWKRANRRGTTASITGGFITMMIACVLQTNLHPSFLGFLVATFIFLSLGYLKGEQDGY